MTGQAPDSSSMAGITVRYWAAAKAAAGVDSDLLLQDEPTTLADVLKRVLELHRDSPKLEDVVGVCSVLLGDRPVGAHDPEDIAVKPGDVVQLLPPFAGG